MKYYTKELGKAFGIILFSFSIIMVMILLKYKPVYEVDLAGKKIGYVSQKEEIEQAIADYQNYRENNVAFIEIKELPTFEKKWLNNKIDTNEEEVLLAVKDESVVTYHSYAIKLDGETKQEVRTVEEAEEVVNHIKEAYSDNLELDLTIQECYETEDPNETMKDKEVAKAEIATILDDRVKEKEAEAKKKAEEEQAAKKAAEAKARQVAKAKEKKATVSVASSAGETETTSTNLGISLSYPLAGGKVSSRFGARSSIRSGAHTGLDLSAPYGTAIHPVCSGTVTFAGKQGSYGNLIIVSHGNGVETYYGHCSAIYVSAGEKVTTSTTIGAVGSTGNSTGNHLHLEIRKNGTPLNPQNYLYK